MQYEHIGNPRIVTRFRASIRLVTDAFQSKRQVHVDCVGNGALACIVSGSRFRYPASLHVVTSSAEVPAQRNRMEQNCALIAYSGKVEGILPRKADTTILQHGVS